MRKGAEVSYTVVCEMCMSFNSEINYGYRKEEIYALKPEPLKADKV